MNLEYIIAYGILGFGFLSCLFLIIWIPRRRHINKSKDIEEYKEGRDKLTFRKPKEKVEVTEYSGFSLGGIMGGFIAILIGVSLLPLITDQVNQSIVTMNNETSVASEALTLSTVVLSLTPIFFAVTILLVAISLTWSNLRGAGLV